MESRTPVCKLEYGYFQKHAVSNLIQLLCSTKYYRIINKQSVMYVSHLWTDRLFRYLLPLQQGLMKLDQYKSKL